MIMVYTARRREARLNSRPPQGMSVALILALSLAASFPPAARRSRQSRLQPEFGGGDGDELIRSVALGPNGEVVLVGRTSSLDFKVTADALQPDLAGSPDAFVVLLTPREAHPWKAWRPIAQVP